LPRISKSKTIWYELIWDCEESISASFSDASQLDCVELLCSAPHARDCFVCHGACIKLRIEHRSISNIDNREIIFNFNTGNFLRQH